MSLWKTLLPPGFGPRTAQPITNQYTDYAISTHANTIPASIYTTTAFFRTFSNSSSTNHSFILSYLTRHCLRLKIKNEKARGMKQWS